VPELRYSSQWRPKPPHRYLSILQELQKNPETQLGPSDRLLPGNRASDAATLSPGHHPAISEFMIAERERRFPVHIRIGVLPLLNSSDREKVRKICGRWTYRLHRYRISHRRLHEPGAFIVYGSRRRSPIGIAYDSKLPSIRCTWDQALPFA
jgi:hypothetical protein